MSPKKPAARTGTLWQRLREWLGVAKILCDSCKYDYAGACRRPDRPNATRCPDYKKR